MRRALILGVGNAQVDAIRYLKKVGWWVIGCSYRHEGSGLQWLDQFELVDILDAGAVEALARREGIDLLYSIGSDLAALTAAQVAPRLGLPSPVSYETVRLMQHKGHLRKFLATQAISPVKYRILRSVASLADWDTYPAFIKPVDSQGQRGVFCAGSRQEAEAGLARSLAFSRSETAIVEEYLDGPEVSVSAFVSDARLVCCQVSVSASLCS